MANPVTDSDDEIVWGLSDDEEGSLSSISGSTPDEYVILSCPRTPETQTRSLRGPQTHTPVTASDTKYLNAKMGAMTISATTKKKKKKRAKQVVAQNNDSKLVGTPSKKQGRKRTKGKTATAVATPPNPYPSPISSPEAKKAGKMARAKAKSTRDATGIGVRAVTEDVSNRSTIPAGPTLYEEASTYISRFISSPDAKHDSVCKLTLLQSLIVELGLATCNLPASLKSARNVLKSHAFLNIREYIAVRGEGPEAIRKIMFPSRNALIKSIRKNPKNRAPLDWVKDMGLQVLLVGWA